jgi:hypothetical protein
MTSRLVRKSNGVEPSLVSHIPAAVAHVIDAEPVPLGPVAVELADIVVPRRIVVRGLEVLRLEHPVGVGEVELADRLLALRAAESSNIRSRAGAGCGEGHGLLGAHGGMETRLLDEGWARRNMELRSGAGSHHLRLAVDEEGRLTHVVGMALNLGLNVQRRLSLDIVGLLLNGHLANGRLLEI